MKKELVTVDFERFYLGYNVRVPGLAEIEALYNDIEHNGLEVPVWGFETARGIEVIRGHLRITCLQMLKDREPDRFAALFSAGVECFLISGISYDEAQLFKLDHGNEQPLGNPMELQLSANLMLDKGLTEKEIATRLHTLMVALQPMKPDKRNELASLREDIELRRAAGRTEGIEEKEKQISTLLLEYHRGKIQNMRALWSCPHIVMATMWEKNTGKRNWEQHHIPIEVPSDDYLPTRITMQIVKSKLSSAFKADMEVLRDGVPVYDKHNPGPSFKAAWEEQIKKSKEADERSAAGVVRKKAMSKEELKTDAAQWRSTLAKGICSHHQRAEGTDLEKLKELDSVAFYAEIFARHNPSEWDDIVVKAKTLHEEVQQRAAETVAEMAKSIEVPESPEPPEPKPVPGSPSAAPTSSKVSEPAKVVKAAPKKRAVPKRQAKVAAKK